MIQAVIFDLAGTTVDFGSRAPMAAFVKLFARYEIDISIQDARGPMGVNKWNHIDALLHLPHVELQWIKTYGRPPTATDVDEMLAVFTPMNLESIRECAELIPGTREVVALLRSQGIRIGATTGYTREIVDVLLPLMRDQGYEPDVCVCAGDTPLGRPSAQMVMRCGTLLGITDPTQIVKVDDTVPGLMEGRNFGSWTVGVSDTGNAMGLSCDEYWDTPEGVLIDLRRKAVQELQQGQPHYVITGVDQLLSVIDDIHLG